LLINHNDILIKQPTAFQQPAGGNYYSGNYFLSDLLIQILFSLFYVQRLAAGFILI